MPDSIETSIARLEEKLDGIIERLNRREATDDTARVLLAAANKELEERVATLERWRSGMLGGAAAIGAVAGLLANKLLSLIN